MKRFLCLLLVLLLPVLSFAEVAEGSRKVFKEDETDPFPEDAQLLVLRVCPILGADCMLLTYGEHSMLIDVAKDNTYTTVLEMVHNAGLDSVESIFNTHPHRDHVGGTISLINAGLGVGKFYTVFPRDYVERKGAKNWNRATLQFLEEKNIPIVDLKTEDKIPFGDVSITVLRIPDEYIIPKRKCNEMSAMLKIVYGDCTILLTADVEPTYVSQGVLAELYDLKTDILKYPHHGISYMQKDFMAETDPEYVFFTHSASDTKRAQKYLIKNGYSWMNFATWGLITIKTDGKKMTVRQDIPPEYEGIDKRYKFPE